MILRIKWKVRRAFLLLSFISLWVPVVLFAQLGEEIDITPCGFIIALSGLEDGFADCDNPFAAAEGSAPYSVFLAGTLLPDAAELELELPLTTTVLVSPMGEIPLEAIALYRQVGDNYQEITVSEVIEGQQYDVSITTPGEYVLVFNRSNIDDVSWQWPTLVQTAHAQFEAELRPPSTVFEKRFTVRGATPVVECGIFDFGDFQQPIENCDNPFGIPQTNLDLEVSFANTQIIDGNVVPVLNLTSSFSVTGTDPSANFIPFELWRHVGDNRVLETRNLAGDSYQFTATGTYTIVVTEDLLVVTKNWWQKLWLWTVPVAHAALGDRTIIEFTVTDASPPPPEPTGASSVLFLPGIQASRLYKDGIFGTTDQVWPPTSLGFSQDIADLAMTEAGESQEDIYTDDIIESIAGISPIYGGLVDFLDEQETEGVIADWQPYAYDWRFGVVNIAKNGTQYESEIVSLIDTVIELSTSGNQVTLLAHSNGGLLAKALMIELEERNLDHLVDRVILLASPQTGTPKALGTLLHGLDQSTPIGLFMSKSTARSTLKNFPGVYGLLPTDRYLESSNDSVVTIQSGSATEDLFTAYGESIDDISELRAFLRGDEGREEPGFAELDAPALSNDALHNTALSDHQLLDAWRAPDGVQVIEIVGVGLPTLQELQYRTIQSQNCVNGLCAPFEKLEPFARFDLFGDETVSAISAAAYAGNKEQYFFDLATFDLLRTSVFESNHVNISEIDEVQTLLNRILTEEPTTNIQFVSTTMPDFSGIEYQALSVHSPITIALTDTAGNETSVDVSGTEIKTEIPGSRTFIMGSSTYIFIPTETEYSAELTGTDEGSYTLLVEQINNGDRTTLISELKNATVTPTTKVSFTSVTDGISNIETDFDGDGTIDLVTTPVGDTVIEIVAYDDLFAAIRALDLSRYKEQKLLRRARVAHRFNQKSEQWPAFSRFERRALNWLRRSVKRMERRGTINTQASTEIQIIIDKLKSNG